MRGKTKLKNVDEGLQMNITHLLHKKRDGGEFSSDEMEFFVSSLVNGKISGSQIGAMLMAMYLQGLSGRETVALTQSMVESGDQLHWDSKWQGLLADKHSTGGIGDKISLILAPVMAACGLKVPMISGRSLEFTGGTLDKLESIPGFIVDLEEDQAHKALEQSGCFIMAATKNLCPADKIIYGIRDVTCTVDNHSLITSSIISKKVASGGKFLIMDVKVGKAAFMQTKEKAKALAKELIQVSAGLGVTTRAVLTRMDEPLGTTVGNSLEVIEAVQSLQGHMDPHVARIVQVLGTKLLQMTKKCVTEEDGVKMIQKVIQDGSALDRFHRMLSVQGVSDEIISRLVKGEKVLPTAKYTTDYKAADSGWVAGVDAMAIGVTCQWLGATRATASSKIDHSVGVQVWRRVGQQVKSGDVWLTVHHNSQSLSSEMHDLLTRAITISPSEVKEQDIIIEVIE